MSLSLRVPLEKNEMLRKAAAKTGKTKSAYILEAIDEKLGLMKGREEMIRKFAGWLSSAEAKELRESVRVFDQVNKGDWD
jgi:hypothetical protein